MNTAQLKPHKHMKNTQDNETTGKHERVLHTTTIRTPYTNYSLQKRIMQKLTHIDKGDQESFHVKKSYLQRLYRHAHRQSRL